MAAGVTDGEVQHLAQVKQAPATRQQHPTPRQLEANIPLLPSIATSPADLNCKQRPPPSFSVLASASFSSITFCYALSSVSGITLPRMFLFVLMSPCRQLASLPSIRAWQQSRCRVDERRRVTRGTLLCSAASLCLCLAACLPHSFKLSLLPNRLAPPPSNPSHPCLLASPPAPLPCRLG